MYIIETKSGKFRACEKYRALDGTQKTASVTIDRNTPQTRKEAQRRLFDIIADKTSSHDYVTLSGLLTAYIEAQKNDVKASTWTRNEASLKRLVNRIIGDLPLNALTAGLIRTKITEYTANPVTYNNYIRHLKAMLNWGFENDFLANRTCIDKLQKKKAPTARQKIQDKYLERDELTAVLEALPPFYSLIAKFQVLTGLRIGEIIALNDDDIGPDAITVNKTLDVRNKIITSPKSEDSNRLVSVQDELKPVIGEIRKMTKINKMKTGKRSKRFIIGAFGDPLSYTKYNAKIAEATEAAAGRRLTTHALRHTHVSLLAEAGIPLEVITRRIGHSDSKITKDIYLHITSTMRERDAEMVAKVAML